MAFEEIETITIHSETDDYYESSYLDGNYLYVAEVGSPVIVHKIDLTTNTEVAELEFDSGTINWSTEQTVVADDDYIYWGCIPVTGKAAIVKIDKSSFEVSSILNLNSAEYFDYMARAVYDPINKVSYWVCWDLIHKVDMTSFTKVSTLDCGVNYQAISSIQIDATSDYLYISTNVSNSRISKIQISSFSIVDYLVPAYANVAAMCIDTVDNKLYAITEQSTSRIEKINLATFASEATIQLPASEDYFNFALCDSTCRYAYFTNFYRIAKISLQTFEQVDSIELTSGSCHENIMITSSHHIYLAMYFDNMRYIHIDASCSFPISSILMLDEEPIIIA